MKVLPNFEYQEPSIVDELVEQLVDKRIARQDFLVAIDGRDGSGKTTLGHLLALSSHCHLLDADLVSSFDSNVCQTPELEQIVRRERSRRRPLILSGVCIARSLSQIDLVPDVLVRMVRVDQRGCDSAWASDYDSYEQEFRQDYTVFLACSGSAQHDRQCFMLGKEPVAGTDGVAACAFCREQADVETRSLTPWHK